MKKLLCSAACVLGLCSPAAARTWWIVDFGSGYCIPAMLTPEQMNEGLRHSNDMQGPPEVQAYHDDQGRVFGVRIQGTYRNGQTTTMLFTTTQVGCQALRETLIEKGMLTNPADLR